MEIISNKRSIPVKGILYGVPGIGKSTFAAAWPKPLFVDMEQGTWQLDVDRVVPQVFAEIPGIIRELTENAQGYRTLVFDSADWLETMMIRHICNAAGIDSIEKYEKGYGKGWNKLAEDWAALLDQIDRLRLKQQMHILFIAHSKTKRYEPADDSGYDRYTLTMADRSAEVLKKWADMILFVKYDTFTVEEGGKIKVKGSDKRVMYTAFHPCWDAKNRYGLPDKCAFEIKSLKSVFEVPAPAAPAVPAAAPDKAPASAPDAGESPAETGPVTPRPIDPAMGPGPDPDITPEQAQLLDQIDRLIKHGQVGYADVTAEIARKGIVPAGTPIRNYNIPTLRRIIAGWSAITHNIQLRKGK